MFKFSANIIKMPPSAAQIMKQINYGTMKGINQTAKDTQREIQYKAQKVFTNRKPWYQASSPIGIKVKWATRDNLTAEVTTKARFGELQDKGGTKLPYGNHIAVPTANVRPTKSSIIPKALRPENLKNSFVITAKSGAKLLCVRGALGQNARGQQRLLGKNLLKKSGGGRSLIAMYVLVKRVNVKRTDFFEKTAEYYAKRWLPIHIKKNIEYAFATMK